MPEYRHGALHVVEDATANKDGLQRELRQLDRRLFLERQITLSGEDVWCVVMEMGDEVPQTILEWRDPDDRPIPLTSGIVERVKQMMSRGDTTGLGKEVARRNHEMIERRRAESYDVYREIATNWLTGQKRSTLLPRGVSLRMARGKRDGR